MALETEQDNFNDYSEDLFAKVEQITIERVQLKLQENLNMIELNQVKDKHKRMLDHYNNQKSQREDMQKRVEEMMEK